MFMKEKPGKIFWWGTALSLVGVVLIVGFEDIMQAKLNTGSLLAIAASAFYGAYLLTVRKGRNTLILLVLLPFQCCRALLCWQ